MEDIKTVSHFVHKPHAQEVNIWGLKFFINACRKEFKFDKIPSHSLRYTVGDQEIWLPMSHLKHKSPTEQKTSKILKATPQKPASSHSGHSFPDQENSACSPICCLPNPHRYHSWSALLEYAGNLKLAEISRTLTSSTTAQPQTWGCLDPFIARGFTAIHKVFLAKATSFCRFMNNSWSVPVEGNPLLLNIQESCLIYSSRAHTSEIYHAAIVLQATQEGLG